MAPQSRGHVRLGNDVLAGAWAVFPVECIISMLLVVTWMVGLLP